MDWIGSCKGLLNRPRIVHRLPGRVRVHIPFLQRLPGEHQKLADSIASLLAVPEEIVSAEANLTTGNALICFDPSSVTEADLLRYLRDMFEIFLKSRERFEGLAPEMIPQVFERLEGVVRDAVHPRLEVNTQQILNDGILE